MQVEVRVPEDVWPTRAWSGKLVALHVGPGDCVSKGDVVAEVEVEKAVLEVTSPVSGRVVKLLVSEGEAVGPGTTIAVVEPGAC